MRRLSQVLLIFWLLVGLAACAPSAPAVVDTPPPPTSPPAPTLTTGPTLAPVAFPTESPQRFASVRIVHAVPDLPPVNIFAGLNAIATNLSFGQSTDLTPVDATTTSLAIRLAGAIASDALVDAPVQLAGPQAHLLVLAGTSAEPMLLAFPDSPAPLNAGESAVTIINALADDRSISLRADEATLLASVRPLAISTTAPLDAGEINLEFVASGSTSTVYPITLRERFQETLVLAGTTDNIAVVRWSVRAPGRATVRIINASAPLGAADVYLNEQAAASGLGFGRATNRISLVAGSYDVRVYPAGADPTRVEPYTIQPVTLTGESPLALVVLGETNALRLLAFTENLSPTPPERARIGFLNTLPAVPVIQLETQGGPLPEIPLLSYGEAPLSAEVPAGDRDVYLTGGDRASASTPLEAAIGIQLRAGFYYLYLVTGRLDNNPIILSENVGIDESLSVDEDDPAPLGQPAQLRFINALYDRELVDLLVNEALAAEQVSYGSAALPPPAVQRSLVASVRLAGQTERLAETEAALEPGSSYTIIAYGSATDVRLLLLPDAGLIFDKTAPHIRFINISLNSDLLLGLGFSPPDTVSAPSGGSHLSLEGDSRRSIPAGVQRVINALGGGSASEIILMPSGLFDIELLDAAAAQLAATIPGVRLEAGAHYDIIAYQEPETDRVRGFLLRYPAGSG